MSNNELKELVLSSLAGKERNTKEIYLHVSKKSDKFSERKVTGMVGYLVSKKVLERKSSNTFIRSEPPNAENENLITGILNNFDEMEDNVHLKAMMEQMLSLMNKVCLYADENKKLKLEKQYLVQQMQDLNSIFREFEERLHG